MQTVQISRMCRRSKNDAYILKKIVNELPGLTPFHKDALELRYFRILEEFKRRCYYYSFLFHTGHIVITVGSLVVPALLSVQYTDSSVNLVNASDYQARIYWLTWIISLLVTMFNGILVLFKVDKKYYFLHTTEERLRSEGWQFFQLTGRYAGGLIHYSEPVTHSNQLKFFCHYVEKIRMKQIEEEYYKHEETSQNQHLTGGQGQPTQPTKDSLYPPSISQPIRAINHATMPNTVKTAIKSLIHASSTVKRQEGSDAKSPPSSRSSIDSEAVVTYEEDTSPPKNIIVTN